MNLTLLTMNYVVVKGGCCRWRLLATDWLRMQARFFISHGIILTKLLHDGFHVGLCEFGDDFAVFILPHFTRRPHPHLRCLHPFIWLTLHVNGLLVCPSVRQSGVGVKPIIVREYVIVKFVLFVVGMFCCLWTHHPRIGAAV